MKLKAMFQMVVIIGFTIVFYANSVFAAESADILYQKLVQAAKNQDVNALRISLNAVLACNDVNTLLKVRAYQTRARFIQFESLEQAQEDCNSAITIAKNEIDSYLSGRAELSKEYLIDMCKAYGSTLTIGTFLLCEKNMYNEAAALNQSYAEDVMKLGSAFDVDGQKQVIDSAKYKWRDAAEIMVKAQNLTGAHIIYNDALQIISNLNWAKPEMTEAAVYTMQMGALLTSDVNDESFGASVAELIEKNKTKSWIVYSSIDVSRLISFERQYKLYTELIKAQPTAADEHSMALLYYQAYTAAKQAGHPEEAVIYYKTLKQKYPNDSLSKLP